MNQHELALIHVHKALKSSQTELPVLLRIKLKYRLAQSLLELRDYTKCSEVLKHLKTYCNMEQQLQMSKVVVTLWEQAGKLSNQQKEGRYTGKDLFEAKS